MRVDDMMLFTLVVRLESFRAAAEQRNLTSSVVSKHISRLEDDLGTQLLHRTTRKLNLTEAGKLLYRHCQMLEEGVALASEELHAYQAEPSGVVRISAPGVSGQLFLPKVINRFLSLYPKVEVEMVVKDQFDDLIEDGFDLAIRTGRLEDSSLICKRLVTSCWHAFASPAYIKKYGAPKTLKELSQHACLQFSYQQTGEASWPYLTSDRESQLKVNGRFRANSLMGLYEAALDGMGIAFLPLFLVRNERSDVELIPVLLKQLQRRVGIYAVYPQTRYLPPKTRAFIELLETMFAQEAEKFCHTHE